MNEETNNIAETVERLTIAGVLTQYVHKNGVPFRITTDGNIIDLEKFLPAPTRTRRKIVFVALESFTRYVNQFKDPSTMVFVDRAGNATATLDGDLPDAPAWREHIANFNLTHSERWNVWTRVNKQTFTQKKFADFIEDNTRDFLAPSGGQMLDIAKTMAIEQNSNFKSGLRLENGDVSLAYERTTVAKGGTKDALEIPSRFTIQVPILEGESPRPVDVRLRYELDQGKLSLSYEILDMVGLLDQVRKSIVATISNETKLTPFVANSVA